MGEEGGWRLSPKVPHAPTHSATPWKRVAEDDSRLAGCAHAFSAECTRMRGTMMRWRRGHTHENSGVERLRGRESPFGLKGKGEFENV